MRGFSWVLKMQIIMWSVTALLILIQYVLLATGTERQDNLFRVYQIECTIDGFTYVVEYVAEHQGNTAYEDGVCKAFIRNIQ